MKKKKIVALCATVALAAVAFGGVTLAYFTDEDQVNNNFTIGNISIDLTETGFVKDADGNELEGAYEVQEGNDEGVTDIGIEYNKLMPSYQIGKKPVITNDGDNTAYVRVAVVMNNLGAINEAIDEFYEEQDFSERAIQEKYDEIFKGWGVQYTHTISGGAYTPRMWMAERTGVFAIDMAARIGNEGSNYYVFDTQNKFMSDAEENDPDHDGFDVVDGYYKNAVKADERVYVFYLKLEAGEGYTLFDGLNIPAEFDAAQMAMFDGLSIEIYADAIQADGFNDTVDGTVGVTEAAYEKAFKALEDAHPLGWWN